MNMATVAAISDTTIVGENEDQLVTMIVDDQLFGIPILQVQDIVEASKITPVPLAPSAIAGVLNLRGRIVTVIDLRKLLGNHEEVPWDSQMGVTVEYKGDLYTLLVDAIGDVRTLPKRDFDTSPSTMEDNVRQLCSGIYRLRGNLLVVLDVSRILHTDVIDATPMLSVEERRSRKEAATAAQAGDGDGDGKSHQLSALMTDLNSYESDTEGVFGATDSDEDDVKARKRANRDRRPVGERWKEVLDEKARKSGQVSYRMREPDEETVENARDETMDEDAEWASRVMDSDDARLGGQDDAPAPEALMGDAAPDLPDTASGQPDAAAPWYEDSLTPATDDMPAMPDSAPEPPAEEAGTEISDPFVTDDMPEIPMEEAKAETPEPAVPDDLPEIPMEEARAETPEPAVPDDMPEIPVEEAKLDTEESAAPVEDTGSQESSSNESGGIGTSWWNKLRGKNGDAGASPEKVEDPSTDEANADAKPDEAPAKKAKSAAKKTKAKKSSKSGSKSKASPKSKKKI